MSNKSILIVKNGEVVAKRLSKPQGPRTLRVWLDVAAAEARRWVVNYYLIRYSGKWWAVDACDTADCRSFPVDAREAAEMFLLYKESLR